MATVREVIEKILGSRLSSPDIELANAMSAAGSWTAVIRGSGTAGTYQIASQSCRYTRIGNRVWADFHIIMAAVVTGGGTGYVQITGLPYAKIASTFPVGAARLHGVDYTASAGLNVAFVSTGSTAVLYFSETNDNASASEVQISGLAANDQLSGSISYETA